MRIWKDKIAPTPQHLLAPAWYLALKRQGASTSELRKAVENSCVEADETLIDLMIACYEA